MPTGKTKTKRTCEQSQTVTVSAGQDFVKSCFADSAGHTNCFNATCSPKTTTGDRRVKWGEPETVPITREGEALVGEGTVWSYDPKLAPEVALENALKLEAALNSGDGYGGTPLTTRPLWETSKAMITIHHSSSLVMI